MKKIFIAASLVFASLISNAQDEGDDAFKASSGDVTGEFSLTGGILNSALGLNNASNLGSGGQLKIRYFLSDELAIRIGFNISRYSEKDLVPEVGTTNVGEVVGKFSQTVLNLGIEKHFNGTKRLSPYVGADILVSNASTREEGENVDLSGDFASGTSYTLRNSGFSFFNTQFGTSDPTPGFGVGLRLVAGADFYFVKNVYLGGEFGWGFLYTNEKDGEVEFTTAGATTTTSVESGRTIQFAPSVITGVRLGFVF